MRDPPYDRPFALAAQVLAMKDHYLEVACRCGARRVIAVGRMAENPRTRIMTLAIVAAKVKCADCFTGPDEVHLTVTISGLHPSEFGGDSVWALLLWRRGASGGSYHGVTTRFVRNRTLTTGCAFSDAVEFCCKPPLSWDFTGRQRIG
jgi:hypothetical protein